MKDELGGKIMTELQHLDEKLILKLKRLKEQRNV